MKKKLTVRYFVCNHEPIYFRLLPDKHYVDILCMDGTWGISGWSRRDLPNELAGGKPYAREITEAEIMLEMI